MDHDHDHNHDHGGGGDGCHGCSGGGHDSGSSHMMSMSFHTGYKETILFEGWKTTTQNELLLAVFIVGVAAALYEGLKYSRAALLRSSSARKSMPAIPGSTTALHSSPTDPTCAEAMFSSCHLIQTLLHALQFTVSYMLMLVFMTYNVWLCVGVVVGATLGYFFFGWRRSTAILSITEHCH